MADLQALKAQLDSLTLLEAAELVKMLEESWGVSAAAPAAAMMAMPAAGGGAAAAAPVEEQTEFDVILKSAGDKKINVIKVVRALTNLGLKEAKDLVEGAPQTVLSAVGKQQAEDAKKQLEAEGAAADIK